MGLTARDRTRRLEGATPAASLPCTGTKPFGVEYRARLRESTLPSGLAGFRTWNLEGPSGQQEFRRAKLDEQLACKGRIQSEEICSWNPRSVSGLEHAHKGFGGSKPLRA